LTNVADDSMKLYCPQYSTKAQTHNKINYNNLIIQRWCT